MDLLSRPVTYLTWTVRATDVASHDVVVMLDAAPEMATSIAGQSVVALRHRIASDEVLSVGTRDQAVLNRSGDDLRIDWGYFHIAVPNSEPSKTTISAHAADAFARDGNFAADDDMEGAVASNRYAPHLAVALPFGSIGAQPVSRHLLVSYTEGYAIQRMQQNLRPYWKRNNKPVAEMLDEAERDYAMLEDRGSKFDTELTNDLTRQAGEHYAWLCTLAYRQAIAAHKLVADAEGHPLLFAKENFSNGDISTVDVMYPSAPIFLFFNPRMLEAQVLPVSRNTLFAMPPSRWHFSVCAA